MLKSLLSLKILRSRIFITGVFLLFFYVLVSFAVYRFVLLNLESHLKADTMLEFRAVSLSIDIKNVIAATEGIINYTKENNKTELQSSLIKLKKNVPTVSKDFNLIINSMENNPYMAKTVLPYMKKAANRWNYYTVPILSVLIKHHRLVSSRVFDRKLLDGIYESTPVYAPKEIKAIKHRMKNDGLIRERINIIYIFGSFIIFSITLIFLIIFAYKNEIIKESEKLFSMLSKDSLSGNCPI